MAFRQYPSSYLSSYSSSTMAALAVHSILAFTVFNNLAVLAVLKHLAILDLQKTSNKSITKY